jgi:DNA-binding transcriptional MerR regulator/methylmalonyl-CoA mutase cobalamin-binding subunit
MNPAAEPRLPIRTVSALTGVNPITLRAWERRYGLIRPLRTAKGHRLYTHDHVRQIQRVLALVRRGVAIGQVREALQADAGRAEPQASGPWAGYRRRLADAIAALDEAAVQGVYEEALTLQPLERVDRMLLLPMLEELGRRWSEAAGGLAEEHFFSAYLRNKIGARFHHRRPHESGPKILAACAPGEQHELGLLFFALAAHGAGMRVVLLGADVPFAETAAAARRAQCDAVVLSSSIEPDDDNFFSALAGMVGEVRRPVFVGGATAAAYGRELAAAGAVVLGTDIEAGVQQVAAQLAPRKESR